jgi:hypothetical protein
MTVAVVLLDDARFGAGPATVLEVTADSVASILKRYEGPDGARHERIRLWNATPDIIKGLRVVAEHPAEAR